MVLTKIQAIGTNVYRNERYFVDTEVAFALQWETDYSTSIGTLSNQTVRSLMVSGQVGFRRPSNFEIELTGSRGQVLVHRPGNAPTKASLYDHENPFGPITDIELAESPTVPFDNSFGPERYPGASGFLYVISAIEECMRLHGIPGRTKDSRGCFELDQLPMKEQLLTVEITEKIMQKAGYWDTFA
jgi:hypothetical protein